MEHDGIVYQGLANRDAARHGLATMDASTGTILAVDDLDLPGDLARNIVGPLHPIFDGDELLLLGVESIGSQPRKATVLARPLDNSPPWAWHDHATTTAHVLAIAGARMDGTASARTNTPSLRAPVTKRGDQAVVVLGTLIAPSIVSRCRTVEPGHLAGARTPELLDPFAARWRLASVGWKRLPSGTA